MWSSRNIIYLDFFHCLVLEHIAVYLRIHRNTIRNKTGTEGVNVNSIALFTMD